MSCVCIQKRVEHSLLCNTPEIPSQYKTYNTSIFIFPYTALYGLNLIKPPT